MGQVIGYQWVYKQWGKGNSTGSTTSITYPIAFSVCYNIVGNMCTSSIAGFEHNIYPYSISTKTFTMYTRNSDSGGFSWLAFGRQQWGQTYMSASSQAITLPLSMPKNQYIPVTTQLNSKSWEQNMKVTSRTVSSFTINTYSTLNDYVAWHILGYQQWGTSSNASGHTDNFPISFSSTCYGVTFCNNQGVHYNVNCSITSLSKSGVTWYTNANGYYIAVGKQQWGFQTTNRTFPISFASACHFVLCLYQTNGGESGAAWFASYVLSKSRTNYSCGGTNTYAHNYIALGVQQWGYVSSYDGQLTVTFPLKFTSTGFTVVCCAVSGGSTGNAWGQLARGTVTTSSFKTTLDGEGISYWAIGK